MTESQVEQKQIEQANEILESETETERTVRRTILPNITMLTAKEFAEALGTSDRVVGQLRKCGLVRGIKIGNGWKYSQEEILKFQRAMAGEDISNPQAIEKVVSDRRMQNQPRQ